MTESVDSRCDSTVPKEQEVIHTVVVTAAVLVAFLLTKVVYDGVRRRSSRVAVLVVGAGPVGLTAALIAARSGWVRSVTLVEEKNRSMLINRCNQVAFDSKIVAVLTELGVDFDNMEGCRSNGIFFTRSGVYQEYMLSLLCRYHQLVTVHLNMPFKKHGLMKNQGRQLVIVCDGANGAVGGNVGLSDDYELHSCRAYGAVAGIERREQPQIPTAERRVHGIRFDLSEYETDVGRNLLNTEAHSSNSHPVFHFKLFGSTRNRYMSLAVPKSEAKVVKIMRHAIDRSMMRALFTHCFNMYKHDDETAISEAISAKHLRFSPRLYEVRMSQRKEVVAYYEDTDMFVLAEGEAARSCNFHTGMDVNTALLGLESLSRFIEMCACAETDHAIIAALAYKIYQSDNLRKHFVKLGLRQYLFT